MDNEKILIEQLAYYDARAQEYDESVNRDGRYAALPADPERDADWAAMNDAIKSLAPVEHTLELACGTGIWTAELAQISQRVTAIDGAAGMLETNRAKLGGNPKVTYRQADLFAWKPDEAADLVFFGFWLSHVPPDKLDSFLDVVRDAVKRGGRLMIVDEPAGGREVSGPVEDGQYQTRELYDGRRFRIIKVYYDPAVIEAKLRTRGFSTFRHVGGPQFFGLVAS